MSVKLMVAKNNFNTGIVSVDAEHRFDYEPIKNSVRQCDNVYIDIFGTFHMRKGTTSILDDNNSLNGLTLFNSFKIPFSSLNGDFGLLFCTDGYGDNIRVFKDNVQICYIPNTVELTLTNAYNSKGVLMFKYQQSGDALYLVHPEKGLYKIQRITDTNWTIIKLDLPTLSSYRLIYSALSIDIATKVLSNVATPGSASASVGTSTGITNATVSTSTFEERITTAGTHDFIYKSGPVSMTPLYHMYGWNGSIIGNVTIDTAVYLTKINSGMGTTDFIFGNDGQWRIGPPVSHPLAGTIVNLSEYGITVTRTDGNPLSQGNYFSVPFVAPQWKYNNSDVTLSDYGISITGTPNAMDTVTVTYIAPTGISFIGKENTYMRIFIDDIEYVWEPSKIAAADIVVAYAGNYYKNMTGSGTTGSTPPTHTFGTVSDGTIDWKYIHSGYVDVKIISVVDGTSGASCNVEYLDENAIDSSDSTLDGNSFRYTGLNYVGNPCDVGVYSNRLVLVINSLVDGPKGFLSKSGDFENFDALSFGDVTEETGIDFVVANASATINWLSVAETLFIGTDKNICVVQTLTSSSILSALNITSKSISDEGCNAVKPIRIDDTLIFINWLGDKILQTVYDITSESLQTSEISFLLKEHISSSITSMIIVDFPIKQIMISMKDSSTILCLNYNKTFKIQCFYKYTTQAYAIKQLIAIKNSVYGFVPYQICFRGDTTFNTYIEYYDNISYIDCKRNVVGSGVYDSETDKTTFTFDYDMFKGGLKICGINTDGVDQIKTTSLSASQNVFVFDGKVLDTNIGLQYISIFEPMPIQPIDIEGNCCIVAKQIISKVILAVKNLTYLTYAVNMTNTPVALNNNFSNRPYSGEISISDWPGDTTENALAEAGQVYTSGARMIFINARPFGFSILALYIEVNITNDYTN